jgi:hypothetical protein
MIETYNIRSANVFQHGRAPNHYPAIGGRAAMADAHSIRTRERICVECGLTFSYEVKRGTDRLLCSERCRNISRGKKHLARRAAAPPCTTVGCDKRSEPYRKDGLCIACYTYTWRTGRARDPRRKPYTLGTVRRSEGKSYRVLKVPGHPLAMVGGIVYHHRLIAYSARDGICGPCHWCGTPLDWDTAIVDHLNEDGKDNAPSNLVVTCNGCNRARGSMLPFLRRLRPERFNELMALMLKQVRREDIA